MYDYKKIASALAFLIIVDTHPNAAYLKLINDFTNQEIHMPRIGKDLELILLLAKQICLIPIPCSLFSEVPLPFYTIQFKAFSGL